MEKELKFIELRAKGWSYDKISKEIGISKPTLINWSQKHSSEIANQQQLERESFREALKLDRQSRLKMLSTILEKLEGRIAKLDFDSLSADKALLLWLRYNQPFLGPEEKIEFEGEYDLTMQQVLRKWAG